MARALAVMLAATLVAGCAATASQRASDQLVIGVGSTTEQRVLAALTLIELRDAGLEPDVRTGLGGTRDLRSQALRGEIDVFWDYTGAAWSLGMREQAPPAEPVESFERVRRADQDNGLVWLDPTQANATLAMFVRRGAGPGPGQAVNLTWLAGELSSGRRALCADGDFIERSAGLSALAEEYAIDLDRLSTVAAPEQDAIAAVAAGECFAGLATATSGVARNAGLVRVVDDLAVFPAFIVTPVIREDALAEYPQVEEVLANVTGLLNTETLAQLNAEVEAGADPEALAERFLEAAEAPRTGRQ